MRAGSDGAPCNFEEKNMKLVTKTATALLMLSGLASPAFAQSSNSATTTGTTTIIQPVTIAQDNALAFGTLVRPTSGSSTITIGTGSDTVSATGSAVVLRGTTSRARYTVTGEGGETVSVTMPATFSLAKTGAPALTVNLARNPSGNLTLSNALGATGTASLDIGGSFSISDTTPTGAYSGTFTVSVAYN
jgi:hypothetical protein